MDKINNQYRKMIEQIHRDGEKITNNAMQPIFKQQSAALDDLHSYIGKLFINYGKDGLLQLTDVQKKAVKQELSTKLKTMAKEIGQNEVNTVSNVLEAAYKDCYYKQAYILNSGGSNG